MSQEPLFLIQQYTANMQYLMFFSKKTKNPCLTFVKQGFKFVGTQLVYE